MKKLYFLSVIFISFLFTACSVGNVSKSGGVENQGYLQFIQGGNTSYHEGVTVYVDENPAFIATVNKVKKISVKGNVYIVKTGTRHLKVVYKGDTLYEKNIIVTTQETKQINLP